MSRYIDAEALPRHGQRGGLVHWKDIEEAPTIESCEDAISRERIKKDISEWCTDLNDPKTLVKDDVMLIIDNAPTVQPSRPKGEWVKDEEGCTICSLCGCPDEINGITGEPMESNFCGECGADMRGDNDDNKRTD